MDFRALSSCLLALALARVTAVQASDATEPAAPAGLGSYIEQVTVRGKSYPHARVRTITRTGVTFAYEGGLLTARWADLPASWRTALASQIPPEPTPRTKPPEGKSANAPSAVVPARAVEAPNFFTLLGQPPEVRPSVDMRDRLRSLGLWVKSQGKRPSCSVYAILSALELQYAETAGHAVRFDEEFVIKSTETVTGRRALNDGKDRTLEADAGFTLPEVVLAIRAHGLKTMTQSSGPGADAPSEVPERPAVELHLLPQGKPPLTIGNIVQALNAGLPVPIGLAWPNQRATQGGYLDTQPVQPGALHAVTLMGYQSTSGRLEDTVFVFKNSWGVDWGASGYGRVTYAFLARHLQCAVVLQLPAQAQLASSH